MIIVAPRKRKKDLCIAVVDHTVDMRCLWHYNVKNKNNAGFYNTC